MASIPPVGRSDPSYGYNDSPKEAAEVVQSVAQSLLPDGKCVDKVDLMELKSVLPDLAAAMKDPSTKDQAAGPLMQGLLILACLGTKNSVKGFALPNDLKSFLNTGMQMLKGNWAEAVQKPTPEMGSEILTALGNGYISLDHLTSDIDDMAIPILNSPVVTVSLTDCQEDISALAASVQPDPNGINSSLLQEIVVFDLPTLMKALASQNASPDQTEAAHETLQLVMIMCYVGEFAGDGQGKFPFPKEDVFTHVYNSSEDVGWPAILNGDYSNHPDWISGVLTQIHGQTAVNTLSNEIIAMNNYIQQNVI